MKKKLEANNLAFGFVKTVRIHPQRTALEVRDFKYTYKALSQIVGGLRKIIVDSKGKHNIYVSIFSNRSLTSYAAILASLSAGRAYVPLHPDLPSERLLKMLETSGVTLMVVDAECKDEFKELLNVITNETLFILIGFSKNENDNFINEYPTHEFINIENIKSLNCTLEIEQVNENDLAYLLFTSGSTGNPKGVPVNHKNVCTYIHYITERYKVNKNDRFSQMFELNFDLSVHDMFVCWESGACLCIPSLNDFLFPVSYIGQAKISMWFSVPSVAMFIDNYGRLEPDKFPELRYSLFCGEALPVLLAEKWMKAAPNSVVENLYGPTEATIAISSHTVGSTKYSVNGIVPMGNIFEGQYGRVIDEDGNEKKVGESGELCLSGSQVTKGYLGNSLKTKSQYVHFKDTANALWYKTGDRVNVDAFGCYYYLGRIDNQVKILGNRVELAEIDQVVRTASYSSIVATIAWPFVDGIATGIVCFVCASSENEKSVIDYCRKKLPKYMIPNKIFFIQNMPLSLNGKIDKLMLQSMLKGTKC